MFDETEGVSSIIQVFDFYQELETDTWPFLVVVERVTEEENEATGDVLVTWKNLRRQFPGAFQIDKYQFSYILSQINLKLLWRDSEKEGAKFLLRTVIFEPRKCFLDFKSNNMAETLMVGKRELEHSLNWLSTLGGAFSALGDNDVSFAKRAGKVSMGQMLIALRLGSPQIISRCRLYAAISLLQLGNLRAARQILLREYEYAKALPPNSDPRLKRMCIGIWTKLKYEWKRRKLRKAYTEVDNW